MLKYFKVIIRLYLFTVASWILVHTLALVGVFLGIGLLPWWFFFPKQTPCLLCRFSRPDKYCRFCRETVESPGIHYPRTFASAFANSLLLIFLSLFCLGIVFAESSLLTRFGIISLPPTVSFTIPATGQYKLGEIFKVNIGLDGIREPINAVQADLKFDANLLEAVDIATDMSFATVFIQKEIDNQIGFVRLTGGLPNPGYRDPAGIFCSVYFRGKLPGIARVELLPSSLVLANNGQGTNVLRDYPSASYLIRAEKLSWEEKDRQEALLNARVLGAQTHNQLFFFAEEKVLGESAPEITPAKPGFFKTLLVFEQRLCRTILSFWEKILGKL